MIRVHIEADNGVGGTVLIDELLLDTAFVPNAIALDMIRPLLREVIERRNEKNPHA